MYACMCAGGQTGRVTTALLEFGCLKGLSAAAAESLKKERSHENKEESVVARNDASKFLAQTQAGKAMSPEEERRKMLEREADFYGFGCIS